MSRRAAGLLTGVLAVLLSAGLCLFLSRVDNKYTQKAIQPIGGVLLTSEADLARWPLRFLAREWEFYPGSTLSPADFADGSAAQHYRRFLSIGEPAALVDGTASYRLTLLLPEKEQNYALELPEVYSACRLYINGEQILALGDVGQDSYAEGIISLPVVFSASGRTELLLTVRDQSSIYGGLVYPPAFGLTENVLAAREVRLLVHSAAVLLAALGALLSLFYGLRGNQRRSLLFFFWCLCCIVVTGYPLLHSLAVTGYEPWYTLEISCFYGMLALALLMQCSFYELPGMRLTALPCLAVTLGAILRPTIVLFWPGWDTVFSSFSLIVKLYSAACLAALSLFALHRGKPFSCMMLCGSLSFAVCLLCDRMLPLYEPIFGGWLDETGAVLLTLCQAAVCWIDAADAYRFRLSYEEQYRQMSRQIRMQKEHYQQLSAQIEQARQNSHDLRHHLRTLRALAEAHSYDELVAYLDSYEPHLAARTICTFSDNPAADAILCYYAAAAKRQNAAYDVRLALPREISFPDDELCILLGNLLENAVDAVGAQTEGPRTIYLRGSITGGKLGLAVNNSFNGNLRRHGEVFLSTKHEGAGIGLRSVQAIVEKYHGLYDFSVIDKTFHVLLMIPLPESAPAEAPDGEVTP